MQNTEETAFYAYGHPDVVIKLKTSSQKGGTGAELTVSSAIFKDKPALTGEALIKATREAICSEWDSLQARLNGPTKDPWEASLEQAKVRVQRPSTNGAAGEVPLYELNQKIDEAERQLSK